jgi:uncharacterized protein (DUF2336 family)
MGEFSLTLEDVARLTTERSVKARAETAAKVASQFARGDLSPSERQLTEQIFRLMARDTEKSVREALAANLRESQDVPRDLALTLAQDIDSVATPVIMFSRALTDADLIAIVHGQGLAKQMAVAKRATVSDVVSQALVETGQRDVVVALVENPGAAISEPSMLSIVDQFGDDSSVQTGLVQRAKLPIVVAERLVALVSETLLETLVTRHNIPLQVAAEIVSRSREKATVIIAAGADRDDVQDLVHQLRVNGRLTASILLRAACMGDIGLFEAGIAELASVPIDNARKLIHDPGDLGLRAICQKAHIPGSLLPAFRCAVDVAHETEFDGGELDRARFSRRMIERILTKSDTLGLSFESPDLEYLLGKISLLPSDIMVHA